MDNLSGFAPPQNIEAEQAVLGAILIDGDAIKKIDLQPEDFYRVHTHGKIYASMLELHQAKIPIDIITLTDCLRKKGELEAVGGVAYLASLTSVVPISGGITHHASIVKDASTRRKIAQICLKTLQDISTYPIDEITQNLRLKIAQALFSRGGKIVDMMELTKNLSIAIENRYNNKHIISGIPSGFAEIDEVTDGFQGGKVYVVAARTGIGKTAFSLAMDMNAGVPVGRIDLEMSEGQLGIRALASLSQVSMFKLRKGYISREEWQAISKAIGKLAEIPLYFSFSSFKISEIERTVAEMVEKGIKKLTVDYLQLISPDAKHRNREQEVADASRTMKRIAKMYNIPVVVLAQLNRKVEERADKKPTLADLRESGSIETDADVVMFLQKKDIQSKNLTVIFAKGRDEGYAEVNMTFDGDLMTFKEAT